MAKPVRADWNNATLNLTEVRAGFPDASEISEIHDFWLAKCRGNALPSRDDIPIEELRPWLGNVSLVDVEHDPRRFRWRLIGSNIVIRMGRDSTGRWFDEIYRGAMLDGYLEAYSVAVDERRAVFYRGDLEFLGREYLTFDSVHLPLSADGSTVNMLLLCLSFDSP